MNSWVYSSRGRTQTGSMTSRSFIPIAGTISSNLGVASKCQVSMPGLDAE
jgi:hypothetical protein